MSVVTVFQTDKYKFVFDTGDVESFEAPRDVRLIDSTPTGAAIRELGKAHLNLTFKPGKQARWEPV